MTMWYLPCPLVMKIFWPVRRQTPSLPSTARVLIAAMSLPQSGSVMSIEPQALPVVSSSMAVRQRVSRIWPLAGSKRVVPSRIEKSMSAIAIPPWNPKCVITAGSARANISQHAR